MQDPPWILGPPESFQDTPDPQRRQDRAREVALQCAAHFLARTDTAGPHHVLETADGFLSFLLGEDKP